MCLSTEWQLDDTVHFLTNNHNFGILTVDTTYNLGDFYVTPVTYPHLMLQDVKTGKSPLLLEPILIHQSTSFAVFNYFASTLIGCRPALRQLMAFGTDGDKGLVEAFTHSFPYSIQLRCFIHFRRNVEEKLKSLGLPSSVSQEFLDDIFGKRVGNTFQEGLVGSCSATEVEQRLQQLKSVWDSREKAYAPASGPSFHGFFCRYQADVVKYHMRNDLREAAGLGSPPSIFTTNASESVNASIKRKVSFKESDWPKFNQVMKDFVGSQHEEVARALSGRGQYRLQPKFSHYGVTTQEWMRMRPDQRKKIIDNFRKATLPLASKGAGDIADDDRSCSGSTDTARQHCIRAEDSGITVIPLVTLNAMWAKADKLLSMENSVTPAPGGNKKSHMVISYSQVPPHLVQGKADGQYICDKNCPHWFASQICSHTLACAQRSGDLPSFLQWYVQYAENPNISTLAMSGLSTGRGRKGGKAKHQRSRRDSLPVDNYSLRPGMEPPTAVHNQSTSGTGSISIDATSSAVVVAPAFTPQMSTSVPTTSTVVLAQSIASQFSVPVPSSSSTPVFVQCNVNPFYVKPLFGNIRICQGCRGTLRLPDGSIPIAPFDMVVARMERRPFREH